MKNMARYDVVRYGRVLDRNNTIQDKHGNGIMEKRGNKQYIVQSINSEESFYD